MNAGAAYRLGILEALRDGPAEVVHGDEGSNLGEVAEVTDERAQGHPAPLIAEEGLPDYLLVEQRRGHDLARQPVRGYEPGRLLRILLEPRELGDAKEVVRALAAGGVVEPPLRDEGEDRAVLFGGRMGVREPQGVAVGEAVAPAVLGHLVGEILRPLLGVPPADRPPQAPAPAAHGLYVVEEHEEVRARPGHPGQRGVGRLPGGLLAKGGGEGEGEERVVVFGGPAALGDLDDALDGALAVLLYAGYGVPGGVHRELALGDVVGAALGAENEEPVEHAPCVQLEGVAARGILGHVLAAG